MNSYEPPFRSNSYQFTVSLFFISSCSIPLLGSFTTNSDVIQFQHVLVAQSCLILCDPIDCMDCSPPGSSVHEILQARILEQIVISFSRVVFLSWVDQGLLLISTFPCMSQGYKYRGVYLENWFLDQLHHHQLDNFKNNTDLKTPVPGILIQLVPGKALESVLFISFLFNFKLCHVWETVFKSISYFTFSCNAFS